MTSWNPRTQNKTITARIRLSAGKLPHSQAVQYRQIYYFSYKFMKMQRHVWKNKIAKYIVIRPRVATTICMQLYLPVVGLRDCYNQRWAQLWGGMVFGSPSWAWHLQTKTLRRGMVDSVARWPGRAPMYQSVHCIRFVITKSLLLWIK